MGISTVLGKLIGGYLFDRVHAGCVAAFAAVASTILPLVLLAMPGPVIATGIAAAIFSWRPARISAPWYLSQGAISDNAALA